MALVLRKGNKDTRTAAVKIKYIGDLDQDNGELNLVVEFKVTKASAWAAENKALDDSEDKQRTLLERKIVSITGKDFDGNVIENTPENISELLDEQYIQNALQEDLWNIQAGRHSSGYNELKRKN